MHPQLYDELFALEGKLSPEDCRNTIDALHAMVTAPMGTALAQQMPPLLHTALEFVTTSQPISVGDEKEASTTTIQFINDEIQAIKNIEGRSRLRTRIVRGGFGSGKTHIMAYIMHHLRNDGGVLLSSFTLPAEPGLTVHGEKKSFNFFTQALTFQRDSDSLFREYYTGAYWRLYQEAQRQLYRGNPLKVFLNLTLDIFLDEAVTKQILFERLFRLKLDNTFCDSFTRFGKGPAKEESTFRTTLENLLSPPYSLQAFHLIYKLFDSAGFKCLCIFVDDFQNLQKDAWEGHRDSLATDLAILHNQLAWLFNRNQGMSFYIMVTMQENFWSEFSDKVGAKLKEHWRDSVYIRPWPPMGSEKSDPAKDVQTLIRKVLSLYKRAGARIPNNITIEGIAQEVESRILSAGKELYPRKIIETLMTLVKTNQWWSE